MFDDLFNSIIKKLLAMPKLFLNVASRDEFMLRCHRITFYQKLSPAAFKEDFLQNPETIITAKEKVALENYLLWMSDVIHDIDFIMTLLNFTSHDKLGKMMDADLLIPFLCKLMPANLAVLQNLQEVLEFSYQVNERYRYFVDMAAIIDYLKESREHAATEEDTRTEKKIELLLSNLRSPDYYPQPYLLLKISGTCIRRMRECYDEIIRALNDHKMHDFDGDFLDNNGNEKISNEKSNILVLFGNQDHPFFTAQPEVWKNIKKYIAYQEFHSSLCRSNASIFEKLCEFAHKYPYHEANLANDLDEVTITVPENVRAYFYPDKSYTASIVTLSFLWSTAYDTNIPLRSFMDAFIKKITALELAEEVKANDAKTTRPAMTV